MMKDQSAQTRNEDTEEDQNINIDAIRDKEKNDGKDVDRDEDGDKDRNEKEKKDGRLRPAVRADDAHLHMTIVWSIQVATFLWLLLLNTKI